MEWSRGKIIGRGSSASVSMGTIQKTGKVFAVKSVEYTKSGLLQREQKILSSIKCSNIVSYEGYDITMENGSNMYNLHMEYVSGGTVNDLVQKNALAEEKISSYTRSIISGLEYMHMMGLVHCDIKGRNILIGSDGAKIADLGCAKWANEKCDDQPILGTPLFMSPEVARGDDQGFAADIWAVGCTMIEMATGRPPWVDVTDPVSALYRIGFTEDIPEFPKFLSDDAKDFLSSCLRRDPMERKTATQLLKHPFLNQKNSVSIYNSPTSILDSYFWDSLGESEAEAESTLEVSHIGYYSNNPINRLKSLACPLMPNWSLSDESDDAWITLRCEEENCTDKASISGNESYDEEMVQLCEAESSVRCEELMNDCVNEEFSFSLISTIFSKRDLCGNISSRRDFVSSSNCSICAKHEHFMFDINTILL